MIPRTLRAGTEYCRKCFNIYSPMPLIEYGAQAPHYWYGCNDQ